MNELIEAVERLSNMTVESPLRLTMFSGSPKLGVSEHGFWARIIDVVASSASVAPSTGRTRYSFLKVKADLGGEWLDTGEGGNTAYEVNDANVTLDTIHWLRPDGVGGYRFAASGSGDGAGSSGSSTDITWQCVEVLADLVCDGQTTVKQFGTIFQPVGVPPCTGTSYLSPSSSEPMTEEAS